MKIYFAASTAAQSELREVYTAIIKQLELSGHEVLKSWVVIDTQHTSSATSPRETLKQQIKLIEASDIVIIEATTPSLGVGYLLAQALSDRKPILCLYPEAADDEVLSDGIRGATSSLITLKKYTVSSLYKILEDYLKDIDLNRLQKFNFVVSRDILAFIEKGALEEGKSKSEFLRDKIVRELMDKELP